MTSRGYAATAQEITCSKNDSLAAEEPFAGGSSFTSSKNCQTHKPEGVESLTNLLEHRMNEKPWPTEFPRVGSPARSPSKGKLWW